MERKEAIEVVKNNWPDSSFTMLREALETLIPELKESEDERIRKGLIKGFQHYDKDSKWGEFTTTEILAWLEKQGKQPYWKPSGEQLQTLHAQLNEGAVTYPEDKRVLSTLYEDLMKIMSQEGKQGKQILANSAKTFKNFRSLNPFWTIQDAKAGDVLFMDNGAANCVFIYKSFNNGIINKYASYNKFGFEGEHYLVLNDGYVIPATKEQRDLLFQKMKEAGYEWDSVKKKLKKIE